MAAPLMKTLRVSLVDLSIVPAGPGGTVSGEVWAKLSKQVRTVDGQVVVLAAARKAIDGTGIVDFSVPANDGTGIHVDDRGFGIVVGWDLSARGSSGSTSKVYNTGTTVLVTSASPAVVAFSSLAPAVPTDALVSYPTDAAVDAKITAARAIPRWAPLTAYTLGQQVVSPNNDVVSAIAAFTSGAGFVASNWQLGSTFARQDVTAKGMIAFVWDDGFATHDTVAAMANARGQRHTFGVVSNFMNSANPAYATPAMVLAWSQAGHEIANHSVDHSSMTGLSLANRVLQYENSRTAIEAVIGAGKIKSFIYPLGGGNRSNTTDRELYLRYDRIVDTGPYIPLRADDATRTGDFLIRRQTWNETDLNNQEMLARIRQCATTPIILITTGHSLGDASAPTQAQVTVAMDLAQSLGIPCVTLAQAMPPSQRLINPGFEDVSGSAPALPVGWSKNVSDAGQTVESVIDTPDVGLSGARSLRLASTADTGTFAYARQTTHLFPNTTYQVTGRYRVAPTGAGTVGLTVRVQEYGFDPLAAIIATNSTLAAATTSTVWAPFALTFTTANTTRFGHLDFLYANQTGQAWVDHVDIRPSRFGTFGN